MAQPLSSLYNLPMLPETGGISRGRSPRDAQPPQTGLKGPLPPFAGLLTATGSFVLQYSNIHIRIEGKFKFGFFFFFHFSLCQDWSVMCLLQCYIPLTVNFWGGAFQLSLDILQFGSSSTILSNVRSKILINPSPT